MASTILLFSKLGNFMRIKFITYLFIFIIFLSIFLVSRIFLIKYNVLSNEVIIEPNFNKDEILVSVFNFSKPLTTNKYFYIKCRKSAKVFKAITTLCLHSIENDQIISSEISS